MAVIINECSGTVKKTGQSRLLQQITHSLRRHEITANVQFLAGDQVPVAARRAREQQMNAVVVGGGDGTISSAAGVLAGSTLPLGVLPLGTLNHFARDLKIPDDLDAAIDVIAAGACRQVDIADVNGRFFLNTSSIGTYPRVIEERDAVQARTHHRKWPAMALAAIRVLARHPSVRASIEVNGKISQRRTAFVFVGNNVYSLRLFAEELRPRLDAGTLSVLSPRCHGALCLSRLMWRALKSELREAEQFDEWIAPEIWVRLNKPTVRVAVDGEVVTLPTPLHYRIHPGALRVVAPTVQA